MSEKNSGLKGRMNDFGFETVKNESTLDKEKSKVNENPVKGKVNQKK